MSGPEKKVLNLRSVFGFEATVTTPAAATDGASFEIDVVLQPAGHTDNHYHPEQEESYEVLEGTLEVFRVVTGIRYRRESRRQCRVARPMRSETRVRPPCGF
jgi:hypothetical protein